MSDPITRLNAALEGRYRIESELGEGGMATVYLADDLKHERKVALKVLKSELAAVVGAERFLAEIKTTANLQHPHILGLHDSGEADGMLFYVMPHVEGESLRERLDREHQLPVDDAVGIATNVAEALDYAHRQGVIHRDIKPANILLQDGKPVISDFGIALAVSAVGGGRLTETGLSLGTPHYMSPEQATGDLNVGPATDVYAVGCVLYETLVGGPPHTGSTAQAVLGRIVTGHPDSVAEHRSSVPANVVAAIAKALEKVPADRFRNAQGFANALRDTSYGQEDTASPTPSLGRISTLVALAGVMAVLAALGWLRPRDAVSTASVSRTSVLLAEEHLLEVTDPAPLAISPEGRLLVYIGEEGGSSQLYVREIAQFGVRAIPNTIGASQPFISPDGESVAFFVDGSLRRTSIEGGIPIRLAEVASPGGGSWGETGEILYAAGGASLWRVPEDGGESVEVPISVSGNQPPSEVVASQPHWLPGETHALVSVGSSLAVIDLETGLAEPVTGVGARRKAQYARPGYILFYGGDETVSVVPFDLREGTTTGTARPLVGDALEPAGRQAIFAVSRSGTLAYAKGGIDRRLVAVEQSGRETPLDVEPRGYRFPAASPTGDWLAVTVDPAPGQMWMVDLRNGGAQPLTSDGHNLAPGWAPDGSRFAWYRGGVDRPGLHWVTWPGGSEFTFLTEGNRAPLNWPDHGEMFIRTGDWDISVIDVETGEIEEFVATTAMDGYPRVSPNGLWVAYMSAVTGSEEVYVVPRDRSGAPQTISDGGGTEPRWSADGTELIWRNGSTIWKADVLSGPEFRVTGVPERLFSGPYDFSNDNNWDVLPDGRFVMVRSDPNVRREIRLIVNLSVELMSIDGN